MRALRVWVVGIVLVGAGLVSCGGTPPPWVRNDGDAKDPCATVTCPGGYHCQAGACAPNTTH